LVDVVERYLLLGLRLGRHIDGFVDAYYGPPALREQADAEEPVAPFQLADEAAALAAALAFDDEHRNTFLRAQLAGCETTARRLAGEPIGWAEEVARCYGVRPEPTPEETFAAGHEQLDAALAGKGDLGERYRRWLESQTVPPSALHAAVERFESEVRDRTAVLFGLPDGESVIFETVENEPWSGFNYYLGERRSRVVINTDLPIYTYALPEIVAHEMYPGHHTEHVWKEVLLVEERGYLEETAMLTGTPQSVVSEGIATMSLDVVLGDEIDEVSARIYRDVDVVYDAAGARAVRAFRDSLRGLTVNAAHLLNEEGKSADEVRKYVARWSLDPEERAAKSIEFLTHPTWRGYVSSYSSGYERCRAFVGDDPSRFRLLLTTQLTTSDLS
jgi:hypothetical protein